MIEPLYRRAGISEERLAAVRAKMAAQLSKEFEDYVDNALHWTLKVPGYEHIDPAVIRPNTRRAMETILAVLRGADPARYGALLYDVALQRARQGLPPRALEMLAENTERDLRDLAARCLNDPEELFAGAIVARRVCEPARSVLIEAFQRAHAEAKAEVERLARQFSAPILPALPGVLVLPIVGAVSAARSIEILDALLAGVVRHAARTAILDLTGIAEVEASLAGHLTRAAAAVRLIGADLVLVGVSPALAEVLVAADARLNDVAVHGTLADALVVASRRAAPAGPARPARSVRPARPAR